MGSCSRYDAIAEVFRQCRQCRLYSSLLMGFGRNFCENYKFGYLNHFRKVRADKQPWLMARCKAHGQLSIRVHWPCFAIYYGTVPELWSEMCPARLFRHSIQVYTVITDDGRRLYRRGADRNLNLRFCVCSFCICGCLLLQNVYF